MTGFFTRPAVFRFLWATDAWGHTHLGWFHRPLLMWLCLWCDSQLYDQAEENEAVYLREYLAEAEELAEADDFEAWFSELEEFGR